MRKPGRYGLLALLLVLVAVPATWADFEQAMNYYKSGKFLEAASEFQGLVDESPDYADGHFMLGICFMKMGKPADAEKAFKEAIELNPDKFVYHFNLANSYQVRGMYAQVVGTLNNAEGLAPDSEKGKVFKLRGFALAQQKKWDRAVEDLEQALRLEPDGPTQIQLGKAYFALGENQAAVTALRKASKLQPTAECYNLLAESLLNLAAKAGSESEKKRLYSEALTEADALLKLENTTDTRYLVGRAALGTGQFDRAIQSFHDVLAKDANHCNAMANMGKAFTAKGDWANALASLENATTCQPSMGLAWENMGFVLQKMGTEQKQPEAKQQRYNQAIKAYERAQQIKPSASIAQAIETCKKNIEISRENQQMTAEERKNQEEIEAEVRRQQEEEKKRAEWERKQNGED